MSTAQEALAAASESWNAGDLNGYQVGAVPALA